MRVMVMVKATAESEAGAEPDAELMQAMARYNEELEKAGVMLPGGGGLRPSSAGARVEFGPGDRRRVVDGPFAETKELVAGFWLWQVASMDEAIEWVRRCPNPHAQGGTVEIRPMATMEDFGDLVTPEIRAQWERMDMSSESDASS